MALINTGDWGSVGLAGFGKEARGSLDFLVKAGVRSLHVVDDGELKLATKTDLRGREQVHLHGAGEWEELRGCSLVLRSPGLRPDHQGLEWLRKQGVRVITAGELFVELFDGIVVGVTGTVGKGTTVSMLVSAMRAAGVDAVGAMDYSPLVLLLCPPELVVLEQSSFQLMDWQGRVDLAVLLRMDEDHLDWHEDFKEYVNAKGNLLCDGSREGWPLVYLAEGHSDQLAKSHVGLRLAISLSQTIKEGVGFRGGAWWRVGSQPRPLPWLKQLRLEGDFHQENAAAAWLAAEWLLAEKLPAKKKEYRLPLIEESLKRFAGLPHRLQWVGDIKLDKHATSLKVRCYDDSYATRPRASQVAVTHFDQPLALIAGGTDKGASFSSWAKTICQQTQLKRVVLIGNTAELLGKILKQVTHSENCPPVPVVQAHSLGQAFQLALQALTSTGGVLLLSPACASLDMFTDYQHRGECFQALVRAQQLKSTDPEQS